jgi:hypothetical protein
MQVPPLCDPKTPITAPSLRFLIPKKKIHVEPLSSTLPAKSVGGVSKKAIAVTVVCTAQVIVPFFGQYVDLTTHLFCREENL